MAAQERPYQPSLPFRLANTLNIGLVGFLCHSFLYGLSRTRTVGLDRFQAILDERSDESKRERGLITVSNHVSVLDDPMIWGVLPLRYFWQPNNMRWSLGSYDICFKNKLSEVFFSYGNTLPTHRLAHSPRGGLFQPTMTQVIRLLSDPYGAQASRSASSTASSLESFPSSDPFSSPALTYSTNGADSFPAPSAYPYNRFSWIHIFPEGMTHQHPAKLMRYFKWGVARLILEAEPCPDVLPIWIDGPQKVMDYERGFPRPVPRPGKDILVAFGELVDVEEVFGEYRRRWRALRQRMDGGGNVLGVLEDDELKYGDEARQLRIDVTLAVRNEVLKVRRSCGLPDEDPKRGLAETYRAEGGSGEVEGRKADGSLVKPGL